MEKGKGLLKGVAWNPEQGRGALRVGGGGVQVGRCSHTDGGEQKKGRGSPLKRKKALGNVKRGPRVR